MHRRSAATLSTDLSPDKPPRRPFHWALEFPEVFGREQRGFDGIVGNPPFLGGKRITGAAGDAYRDWLITYLADGRRGSADLVAYFFLRAWSLLCNEGCLGLLAVNTIAEGDTRQVGLEAMVKAGAVIYSAYPNEPWPGKAAVVTSRVHVHRGAWVGPLLLNGQVSKFISAYLSDQDEWSPKRLKNNERIAFQGSVVVGMGFVLDGAAASEMIKSDVKNADVVFPYRELSVNQRCNSTTSLAAASGNLILKHLPLSWIVRVCREGFISWKYPPLPGSGIVRNLCFFRVNEVLNTE